LSTTPRNHPSHRSKDKKNAAVRTDSAAYGVTGNKVKILRALRATRDYVKQEGSELIADLHRFSNGKATWSSPGIPRAAAGKFAARV